MRTSLIILSALALSACGSIPTPSFGSSKAETVKEATPASALTGYWRIISIDGIAVTSADNSREPASLRFDGGQVVGYAHCNRIGAVYQAKAGRIQTNDVLGTMMACIGPANDPDAIMKQEAALSNVLGQMNTYEVSSNGTLKLSTPQGNTVVARR